MVGSNIEKLKTFLIAIDKVAPQPYFYELGA